MAATGRTAFATAHRVIDWIHGDAAIVGTPAEPAGSTGLAVVYAAVLDIAQLPDRGPALKVNQANLAEGKRTCPTRLLWP